MHATIRRYDGLDRRSHRRLAGKVNESSYRSCASWTASWAT